MSSAIEIRAATKRYGGEPALNRVDLSVPRGTTTVLIGPSGCGKSTLLRLVNGLILPDAGEIACFGETLTAVGAQSFRLRMGYVIQEGGLFPHLSARQNVSLMAEELNWPRARIDDRIRYLSELVRLPEATLSRPPNQLSGGQRQRVSIMRALMLEPEIVLLDEPLGALDPMVRFELQNELKEVFRQIEATVLLVTHDMAEAIHFADQVVVLKQGEIIWRGEPQALLLERSNPFVQKLLGSHRALDRAAT